MNVVLDRPVADRRARKSRGVGLRLDSWLRAVTLTLPALAALAAWRLSLRHLDVSHLGAYGLPPALPGTWYLALLICLLGASLAICAQRPRGWVMVLYIFVTILILYGSVAVLSSVPHYSWVYKHFGVTRLLEVTGQANVNVDIYNRWPGFFAIAAIFSRVAGHLNPSTYASWAEVFFVSIDVAFIAAAVKIVARDVRIAAGAALLFVVANWVGQDYYSPQAFAFALSLALLVVVLGQLLLPHGRGRQRLMRTAQWAIRVPQLPAPQRDAPSWPRGAAIAVVLVLDAVIVGSHQLTPYMLLAQLSALILLGLLRTRWFVAVMALMTFAYFAANFSYIQHNFGLFSSIDPFNNVQHSAIYDQAPQAGVTFSGQSAQLLSFLIWLGAAIATVFLARRGLLRRALPLAALAAAPFALIFGQNYGGEASLRVILFSFPWCAALISWALAVVRRPVLKRALTFGVIAAMTALFIPAYLGEEELNIMPVGEVQASNWFYAHAPAGSVLMLAAPDFPARYGPRYKLVKGPQSDDDPNLLRTNLFRHRALGPSDLVDVIAAIDAYSPRGYLVFSTTGTVYARIFRLTPPGALQSLERAVAHSRRFRLYYRNADARIYEVIPSKDRSDHAPSLIGHHRRTPLQARESAKRRARRSRLRDRPDLRRLQALPLRRLLEPHGRKGTVR